MRIEKFLNQLKPSRAIALASLTGSRNYHLNNETSDHDFKIFTYPDFDDLYSNIYFHESNQTPTIDYSIHDVRKLPRFLAKADIGFLEVMYSEDIRADDLISNFIQRYKGEITVSNLPRMFSACYHTSEEKESGLFQGTITTKPLIEIYGYNTKEALHAYRNLDFLCRFHATEFQDFKAALKYNEQDKKLLLDIRNGKYTIDEYREMLYTRRRDTEQIQEAYEDSPVNFNAIELLTTLIKESVRIKI